MRSFWPRSPWISSTDLRVLGAREGRRGPGEIPARIRGALVTRTGECRNRLHWVAKSGWYARIVRMMLGMEFFPRLSGTFPKLAGRLFESCRIEMPSGS